ncbi:50S ribosomal protein L16 [bacterium]|nr:50S ribosomal protein L16 [bacterium]
MLMPRKVKHRKMQRGGRIRKISSKGTEVNFGSFGIKAMNSGLISARQIEAARRAMTRYIQRGGKVWIRIFPSKPMTEKGAQVPMGKGKGSVDHFVAKVRGGKVLFEMDGVTEEVAKKAMSLASYKLGVKTRFVKRR